MFQTLLTKPGEYFPQLVIIHVIPKVFDIDIGEFHCSSPKFSLTLFAGLKVTNKAAEKKQRNMKPSCNSDISALDKKERQVCPLGVRLAEFLLKVA